ncbi:MAG: universal stress protein [Candidatus Entotheonellia bacterium]
MDIRHILSPTDFSEHAKQAVTSAFELAQRFGAKLSLLHVIEVPVYTIEVALPLENLEWDARRELALLLPEAEAAHMAVTRLVELGVPYQRILETATAEQVDLIVMATHGRTGLGHLIMGSVAERVVRLAPCPVLTIRPPGERSVGLRTTVI